MAAQSMTAERWLQVPGTAVRSSAVPIFVLAAWQAWCSSGVAGAERLPSPLGVAQAVFSLAASGVLLEDTWASVRRVCVGFTVAAIAALIVGVPLGRHRRAAQYLKPMIELLRPIPPIAWVPISILWFGLGDRPAYFLVGLGSFFPVFVSSFDAAQAVDPVYVNAARCLGAGRGLLLRQVVIPAASPAILTGLRIGLSVGWICVITAELVGAQDGLGYMIQLNRLMLQTDNVIAGMVVIGLVGAGMSKAMSVAAEHALRWRSVGPGTP